MVEQQAKDMPCYVSLSRMENESSSTQCNDTRRFEHWRVIHSTNHTEGGTNTQIAWQLQASTKMPQKVGKVTSTMLPGGHEVTKAHASNGIVAFLMVPDAANIRGADFDRGLLNQATRDWNHDRSDHHCDSACFP